MNWLKRKLGVGQRGVDSPYLQLIHAMAERQMSNVNSPDHYTQGYMEAIYVIAQVLGAEGFKAFCMGNYLKYQMRAAHKNGQEDIDKAAVYLDWATNGLPEPVNNRLPKPVVYPTTPWKANLAEVRETMLAILNPLGQQKFHMDHLSAIPLNPIGFKLNCIVVNIPFNEKFTISLNVENFTTSAMVTDILIRELKIKYPQGPWQ